LLDIAPPFTDLVLLIIFASDLPLVDCTINVMLHKTRVNLKNVGLH
jgi:hypothetical protein